VLHCMGPGVPVGNLCGCESGSRKRCSPSNHAFTLRRFGGYWCGSCDSRSGDLASVAFPRTRGEVSSQSVHCRIRNQHAPGFGNNANPGKRNHAGLAVCAHNCPPVCSGYSGLDHKQVTTDVCRRESRGWECCGRRNTRIYQAVGERHLTAPPCAVASVVPVKCGSIAYWL